MLRTEMRGEVAVLRMEHGKVNALDFELLEELSARLDELESSGAAAMVLTGSGSTFSAGVDLFRLLDGGPGYLERFLPALTGAFLRLFTFPRPAVAAVNGHAIAGGCILALACDHRILAAGPGRVGVTELQVGVAVPALALEIVRAALPPHHAQEAILTGRTYSAAEALARGFADELAAPEDVLDRACAIAAELGAIPRRTFALTKRQLRRHTLERVQDLADLDPEVAEIWRDEPTRRTIRAYLERTIRKR
jgi:enoyl-CoA hydratase